MRAAAQGAMAQLTRTSSALTAPHLGQVELHTLGFICWQLSNMSFQFLSFNFILLSEMGSGVCYTVGPQSGSITSLSFVFLPFSLITIPKVILIHCLNFFFFSNPLLMWHFPLAITFFIFLLESSEVFYKINLILRTVLDLQVLKYFETCKSFFLIFM